MLAIAPAPAQDFVASTHWTHAFVAFARVAQALTLRIHLQATRIVAGAIEKRG